MSDQRLSYVLQVEGGRALPQALRVREGHRLEPTSFGTMGKWFIVGPGVREVHGYVAFDGVRLYVQSASPQHPLQVEGASVGDQWQPLAPPARIAMGSVSITVRAASDREGNVPLALPDSSPEPGPPGSDEDVTRYHPIEVPPAARPQVSPMDQGPSFDESDATRVDFEPPTEVSGSEFPPTRSAPTGAPAHDAPKVLVDVPPAPRPQPPSKTRRIDARALWRELVVQWKQASLPKKATVALLPVAFVAVSVLFGDNSRPQAAHPAAVSATATKPVAPSSAPPSASATSGVVVPPPAPASPPYASSASRPPPPPAEPAPPQSLPSNVGKTPERLAVDAVVAGSYAEAAQRYEQLAREHPDHPAYREAARILRAKGDAGAP